MSTSSASAANSTTSSWRTVPRTSWPTPVLLGNAYGRGHSSLDRYTIRTKLYRIVLFNLKWERSKQRLVAICASTWTVLVPIYAKHFSTPTYKNEDVHVSRFLSMRVEAASCLVKRPKSSQLRLSLSLRRQTTQNYS